MVRKVKKLPKKPKKGEIYALRTKKGVRCFKATGKKGFGMYKIVRCP